MRFIIIMTMCLLSSPSYANTGGLAFTPDELIQGKNVSSNTLRLGRLGRFGLYGLSALVGLEIGGHIGYAFTDREYGWMAADDILSDASILFEDSVRGVSEIGSFISDYRSAVENKQFLKIFALKYSGYSRTEKKLETLKQMLEFVYKAKQDKIKLTPAQLEYPAHYLVKAISTESDLRIRLHSMMVLILTGQVKFWASPEAYKNDVASLVAASIHKLEALGLLEEEYLFERAFQGDTHDEQEAAAILLARNSAISISPGQTELDAALLWLKEMRQHGKAKENPVR